MNYSKKHLKHIWYKYCFSGGDFRASDFNSLEFLIMIEWDNQRERSLYRKCRRKDKSNERK